MSGLSVDGVEATSDLRRDAFLSCILYALEVSSSFCQAQNSSVGWHLILILSLPLRSSKYMLHILRQAALQPVLLLNMASQIDISRNLICDFQLILQLTDLQFKLFFV